LYAPSESRKMRNFGGASFFIPIALPILALLATPTFPQVRGSYSPGSTLTYGGTVSDPGFSYDNQLWDISSSKLKGPQGNIVPIQGSVSFLYDNNSVIYVPKFKLLHANLEFSVDIVVSNGAFNASDPLSVLPSVSGTAVGLTNTDFTPIDLGWHFKWADLQTGYSVAAPTGRYVTGASNNVSTGFWTHTWQTGTTLYLSKSKNTQISVFNSYAWNTTQQGTGVHPGQNDSVDYSLTQTISLEKGDRWPLQFGPAGYGQWQTTKASGQLPMREPLLYGVDAAGFTVNLTAPFKSLNFGASALWEYHARNTYQGRTLVFDANLTF
jgi:hypothetical protein